MSLRSRVRHHLARALTWTATEQADWSQALASALGMAGPVALATGAGHLSAGLAAATGALAVSGAGAGETARARRVDLAWGLAAALTALAAGVAIAGRGPVTSLALVALAFVAALAGGVSRRAAVAATRFILFLVIAVNLGEAGRPLALLVLAAAGALWTALLILLLDRVFRRREPEAGARAEPTPTARAGLRRWWGALRGWPGWRYPVRITVCLAAAELLASLWPHHHGRWITLTVAILVRRQSADALLMTTQRALGVLAGVLLGAVLLVWRPGVWALTTGVALLAGARPLLRSRNYLAYSAIMTPLVLVLMDFGARPTAGLLGDRLIATLAGAALVVVTQRLLGGRRTRRPGPS